MERFGLTTPSSPNTSINFQTYDNDPQRLINFLVKPQVLQFEQKQNRKLQHEIFVEKGAPFILLNTNLCERPLRLLVDTGASVSILSKDSIKDGTHKVEYYFSLFGIAGKEISVTTEGMVHAIFNFDNTLLSSTMHLVDRKYVGTADGYLGFDFLAPYKVRIDLERKYLEINLENIITTKIRMEETVVDKEDDEADFLKILAENYNFKSNSKCKNPTVKSRKENQQDKREDEQTVCRAYFNAMKSFEKQQKEYETYSLHANKVFREENKNARSEIIFDKLRLDHCTELQKTFVKSMCEKYPNQFHLEGDPIGSTEIFKHHIKLLPNAKIVNVKQYRVPQAHRQKMQEIVDEWERDGIIEKCQSPFNSPAFLIPKKDDLGEMGDFRLVINYKKLNAECEVLNFPIPHVDDIISSFHGSKYFTIMDMKGAFHQIYVDEASRDYTAFTPTNFQYRCVRILGYLVAL